ncbi:AATF leucine zipper-containing domain [Arabidopsis thaliana x Arabidopsis arenosa]|uniref:AATF leucine zipper-containing domain n=2 Tax=Arabidopsis TaxID=3701 RepID=A0A8T1XR53_9BRAS|nr:AATF leucine zipper-containing domain [Arabidopsis thaliana x Arabidopsis arenosa]KAG7535049.1 AATF leucine zipper-containing domain [Arabidopsis thaliana x Arabidopsis arenosa]KAG7538763.1 AATF leucine zipper-containing domain [Arabidopsis suecica]KAG7538764.1 AATF leucine zipper-containing domain [Arabidopsis suecica]
MAGGSKRTKRARLDDSESEDISDQENLKVESSNEDDELPDGIEDDEVDSLEDDEGESEEDDEGDNKEDEDGESEDFEDGIDKESDSGDEGNVDNKDAQMEELEKEYMELRSQEQDILKNLKRDKGEDAVKGQAVKNQKALWDKTLEFRFLLQKAFDRSNRLPQEPVKSYFCSEDEDVSTAYTDLVTSSKKTLDSLLELQEALFEKNPSVDQQGNATASAESKKSDAEDSDEWQRISDLQKRMSVFRNKAVDKWQRRTQVTTGAAAIKGKLHAFNQNVSEQVASYMRDPSRMIKQMQQSRSTVAVFGTVPREAIEPIPEEKQQEGDPELVEDAEFYRQLLKEFLETIDPASSEAAFYEMKKFQTKKRKIVDRRASKSRKIRYNVHEKIVNFMAPRPAKIPPNTADLLKNLFGLKTRNVQSEA